MITKELSLRATLFRRVFCCLFMLSKSNQLFCALSCIGQNFLSIGLAL